MLFERSVQAQFLQPMVVSLAYAVAFALFVSLLMVPAMYNLALLQPRNAGLPAGSRVDVLLRPDDVVHDDAAPLQAEIVQRRFRGAEFLYALKLDSGDVVLAQVPSHHDHAVGQRIGVRFDLEHVVAFAR